MTSVLTVTLCGFVVCISNASSATQQVGVEDRDPRQQFAHMAFVKTAVVLVDQRVGVSIEQNKKLAKVLTKAWDTDGLKLNAATIQAGLPPGFPDSIVTNVLTPEQKRTWKLVKSENEQPIILGEDQDPAPLRKALTNIVEARTAALKAQFQLDAKQLAKFKLASKGAVSSATRKRAAGQKHVLGPLAPGEKLDPELYEYWFCDQASLLVCHTRWTKWVRSSLKEDQRAKYNELLKFRAEQAQDAQLHYLVATNSQRMDLNGEEQRKLLTLLKKLIPVDSRSLRYSVKTVLEMQRLTAKQLQPAIPKEASEVFVEIFGSTGTFKEFESKK